VFKAVSLGTATGGMIGQGPEALWGAGAGLLLAAITTNTRPAGLPITCPQCSASKLDDSRTTVCDHVIIGHHEAVVAHEKAAALGDGPLPQLYEGI
jgi:hypothetical protein